MNIEYGIYDNAEITWNLSPYGHGAFLPLESADMKCTVEFHSNRERIASLDDAVFSSAFRFTMEKDTRSETGFLWHRDGCVLSWEFNFRYVEYAEKIQKYQFLNFIFRGIDAINEAARGSREITDSEDALYSCLDDINTYSDLAKDNYKLYQHLVTKRIRKLKDSGIFTSDGYKVWYNSDNNNLNKIGKTDDKLREVQDKETAISAHNNMARAMMNAKETNESAN